MEVLFNILLWTLIFVVGWGLSALNEKSRFAPWVISNMKLRRVKGVFSLTHSKGDLWEVKIGNDTFMTTKYGDENQWADYIRQSGKEIILLWMQNDKGGTYLIGYESVDEDDPGMAPDVTNN